MGTDLLSFFLTLFTCQHLLMLTILAGRSFLTVIQLWNIHAILLYKFLISLVEKCMRSMQMGTQMVKLRGGSRGLVRFFYLDEHKSCIRWRPSRKNEKAKSEFIVCPS